MSWAMNTLAQNVGNSAILICTLGGVIMDKGGIGDLFRCKVHFSLTPMAAPYNMRALWKR
ncbi:hypothetical protein GCM10011502_09260 [Oceanisphaera marina]|uniref:Uncharacterized protein n=1 Tax=Oceanisphaera marina TaxID=2017550 RepID=A0ABQ1IGN9_9GAMM|nr:hypothetical protein GCM10011502_09260 [Oceanisphaera marina]